MLRSLLLLLYVVALPVFAAQDFAECRQFFAGQTPPLIQANPKATRALCFSEFAALHSGQSKTPLYVAQRLNREIVNAKIKRSNKFFADARLPRLERAELDDYKESGYDRGHMAPAGDMATEAGMAQCFSLANMVPQDPKNNQRIWNKIEDSTRKYIQRASGDVYVITGPVFASKPATIGSNRVWVPSHLYKLIYDPNTKKAWAYWIENRADASLGAPISYAELVQKTGIEFLPKSHLSLRLAATH